MVGKQGLEPHPPAPKAGALTLTLHPVNPILFSSCRLFLGNGGVEWFGGDERNRTAGLLLARQPLSQLSYIPEAAPGPPGVGRAAGDSNSQRPGPGIRHSHPGGPPCSWCSRCGVINWHARSPVGGAPQGWQDSNPRHAVLEAAVLAAELHPMKLKTARWEIPLRAAPGPGLLIVAVTQLPPHGPAAHYYPGQL